MEIMGTEINVNDPSVAVVDLMSPLSASAPFSISPQTSQSQINISIPKAPPLSATAKPPVDPANIQIRIYFLCLGQQIT